MPCRATQIESDIKTHEILTGSMLNVVEIKIVETNLCLIMYTDMYSLWLYRTAVRIIMQVLEITVTGCAHGSQ